MSQLVRTFVAAVVFVSMSACSLISHRSENATHSKPAPEDQVVLPPPSADLAPAPAPGATEAQKPKDAVNEAAKTSDATTAVATSVTAPQEPPQPPATVAHPHGDTVPAEKSLGWLKNGNRRFVKGYLRKDGQTMGDVKRLAAGQNPHAIVMTCSDSRVPPELLFDQKLGEIFVVRNAGPDIGAPELASMEYAVTALGTHLLVVMGHTYCGAVKAAVATMNGGDAGSPSLNGLVAAMHLRLAGLKGHETSEGLHDESWANVSGVARELLEKSPLLKDAVQNGSLRIEQAVYDLNSGKVDFKEN